jgi:hypothetical protein
VDKPVRVSALVAFKGEKRTLAEKDLRKLSEELVRRVVNAVGPHDEPSGDEVLIVSDVLSRSLIRLGELDMDDVQAVRLGHERLAERIGAPIDLFHSPGTYALYRRLLDQCCLHILNFFTQRSAFVARTLVEQSRQLDQLTTRIDLLIERVPPRSAEDAAFEKRYADYIQREHSQLTIYGLDLRQESEWPLDDAYLSLEARGRSRGGWDERDTAPQRAERALSGQERVLLRGLAGSGKTTLVQWLAVITARQDIGEGMTHLVGRVPFVLPMRTLTRDGAPLPSPDHFLAAVNCPLVGAQPVGWTDRVLSARRGLLLVDGIDEIPEAERDEMRRWVRRLIASYPGNLWLVTARPSAVREDWLGREEFAELMLASMGSQDVQAFIHRWHIAAEAGTEIESVLLDLIRSRTDLGTLATNPLMCAMICALHRERHGSLPRGRKALYDAALSMLLERRDRERPDPPRGATELDAEIQIPLLQKLAYWLINNGRSEMSKEIAISLIARSLPVIRRGTELGSPDQILQHLVERSGVLREPAAGAVDFVHRTFQDYLGAREIVEWEHFPALVTKAHKDQWEDVVRMAVAHAPPRQRGELLTQLVERGDQRPRYRVRLHLLATACLEHATQLEPDVRTLVETRAAEFIPPQVLPEARTLVEAGSITLELLPDPRNLTEEEAKMVVFIASRMASEAALTKLRAFRDHPSPDVRSLLAANWYRYDTSRYFDEIVSCLPRHDGVFLTATTLEELRLLGTLDGLSNVNLRGDFSEEEILAALEVHPIAALQCRGNGRLRDLRFLSRFHRLTSLVLDSCPGISDLSPLEGLPVTELGIFCEDTAWAKWSPDGLDALTTLRSLDFGANMDAPSSLPWRAPLERLTLPHTPPPLMGIGTWRGLAQLGVHHAGRSLTAAEWNAIAELPQLRRLLLNSTTLGGLKRYGVRLPNVLFAQFLSTGHVISSAASGSVRSQEMEHLADALPGLRTLVLSKRTSYAAPLAMLQDLREVRVLEPGPPLDIAAKCKVISPPAPRY